MRSSGTNVTFCYQLKGEGTRLLSQAKPGDGLHVTLPLGNGFQIPESAKKIAVIGGGIGGMEVALTAAKRGHDVTIYEKSDKLGGVFIAAAAPDFKEKDKQLIRWYIDEVKKSGITVKFNCEVKDISALGADKVVVATGSKARKLRLPGIERSIEAVDYLLGAPVGDDVVIIGGGLTGCEIAYDLIQKGKRPVIVEMKNDLIAVRGVCLANSSYLRDYFKFKGTPVYLESGVSKIEEGCVTVKTKDGKEIKVKADSVITSVGYDPAPLEGAKKSLTVGDASAVGNLRTVIWRARKVGMKL